MFSTPDNLREVVSIGLLDTQNKRNFLFEATPDIASQLKNLKRYSNFSNKETPDGIFLSHAHIGHYSGLMYLGREALDAKQVPVYAMPRMKKFLEENGPWSQLVNLKNIALVELQVEVELKLTTNLSVKTFLVPHRDEFSETVGYVISGKFKKALFIPDIDKWEKWSTSIDEEIKKVDYAFVDATFYDAQELNNRNIKEIPHPFVIESIKRFKNLSDNDKSKIYFIHFNHTNPLLKEDSEALNRVIKEGYHIAEINQTFEL